MQYPLWSVTCASSHAVSAVTAATQLLLLTLAPAAFSPFRWSKVFTRSFVECLVSKNLTLSSRLPSARRLCKIPPAASFSCSGTDVLGLSSLLADLQPHPCSRQPSDNGHPPRAQLVCSSMTAVDPPGRAWLDPVQSTLRQISIRSLRGRDL